MRETEKTTHDERTKKIISKYFGFFHIKKWLPKKWKKHIMEHLDDFFSDRDTISDMFNTKDTTLYSLSIDGIADLLSTMATSWNTTADSLKSEYTTQQTNISNFNTKVTSLTNDLQKIIDAQNS